ncbi:MAG: carboxypeptidase-like regulatory domain-containing protein, partial [Vicinamibacterales bacterium]
MSVFRGTYKRVLVLMAMVLIPGLASAQSTTSGTIAGTVKDTTGAVLPGVTIEASSPALIEKTRAAVTDEQGNYKIVELRPGTYSVTFTLPGFSTVRREGLELSTGFTANAYLWPMDIRGRGGRTPGDLWAKDGARAYLGT